MHALFPAPALLAAFIAASLVLAATPGPAVFYIVTRTLAQGRRSGLVSMAGVALGNLGNAIGASLGLAALFAVWSAAFTVVKLAGALYLIYLGIQVLRSPPAQYGAEVVQAAPLGKIFRDGFVVALFNPKTAIFFAAFLPQFLGPHNTSAAASIVLGAIFVLVAAVTDTLYACFAGTMAPRFARAVGGRSVGRYASAGAFFGLGVYTALLGSRRPIS